MAVHPFPSPATPPDRSVGRPWTVYETSIDPYDLKKAASTSNGGKVLEDKAIAAFDAANPTDNAQIYLKVARERMQALRRKARRAAKHIDHTRRTRTVVTREKMAKLPWFHVGEASLSLSGALVALYVNNMVLAKYIVNSGNDMYASDFQGAQLFGVLPLLAGISIKMYERFLPSDTAKNRYTTFFWIISIITLVVWAFAVGVTFAPTSNSQAWLTASGNNSWTGIALVVSHVLCDAAVGFILFTAGEKLLLANRKRVEFENPHYQVAKAREGEVEAEVDACLREIAEINAYLNAVAHTRAELRAQIQLEVNGVKVIFDAEQNAAMSHARIQFLAQA